MRLIMASLTILMLSLAGAAQPVSAHPATFHTVSDFQEHIEAHLDNFKSCLSNDFIDNKRLNAEFSSLVRHLENYRLALQELDILDGEIEVNLDEAVHAAQLKETGQTLEALKRLQVALFLFKS